MHIDLSKGVAGFIGFSTAIRLLEEGDIVVGIDNMDESYDPTLKKERIAHIAERGLGSNFTFILGGLFTSSWGFGWI